MNSAPDPAARVVRTLVRLGQTVATCESLSAGLAAATIAQVPGASAVLRGGLVTYATELKASLAQVSPQLLSDKGAVDPEVALAMAQGARRVCKSDWAIALTGVAGPKQQDGKPVGLVFIASVGPQHQGSVQELHLTGSRNDIRAGAVNAALVMLSEAAENSVKNVQINEQKFELP